MKLFRIVLCLLTLTFLPLTSLLVLAQDDSAKVKKEIQQEVEEEALNPEKSETEVKKAEPDSDDELTDELTDVVVEAEETSKQDSETEDKKHNMDSMHDMEMHHATVEALQEMNVKLNVYKDIFSGYSIQLIVNGLTFTPENAGEQHVDGEGHAHLYIDGEKIARVYGTSFHLGNILSEGEHEITISLNGNDHSPYTYDGELVEDTVTVEVGRHGTVTADEEMLVELSTYEDSLGGYNIHIQPTGFAFSAANPGTLHVNGKGYAQIFVNGKVLFRSYTPWYNLGSNLFREGENEIRVKLLSNDHNYYTYENKAVSVTVTVDLASVEKNEEAESQMDHDINEMDMDSMDDMSMEESSEEDSDIEVEDESKEDFESTEVTDKVEEVSEDSGTETEEVSKEGSDTSSNDESEEDIDQKNEP